MDYYKKFIKNIGFLTVSNIGSKLLIFFMIPLYTSVLTTEEYGIYDLIVTSINLLIPILIQNINEAVIRFSLEFEPKNVFTIAMKYNIIGLLLFFLLVFINYIFKIINVFNQYMVFFVIYYIMILIYTNLSAFMRGINRIKILSISGILNTILIIFFNILFLLYFNLGLYGYFLSYIIGFLISNVYILLSIKLKDYINISIDKNLEKDMIIYSRPLVFNTIAWWLNNTLDRYIISFFCGLSANGVYSVAYKIPSILVVFQHIFLQAWQISAYDAYKNKNNFFLEKVYSFYNFFMVLVSSIIIIFTKNIADFFYSKEFYIAWKYVPFLIISAVFGAMSGYIGGIFSAVKESKFYAKSTLVGAFINVILNFILINIWGPIGAAIATLISYIVIWIMRIKQLREHIQIKINILRDISSYFILIIQSVIVIFVNNNNSYVFNIILFFLILLSYKYEYSSYFDIIKKNKS